MSKKKALSLYELIPVNSCEINKEDVPGVNARDVHKFLEVDSIFAKWIQRKTKKYDFVEGKDYVCFPVLESKTGSGGHNIKEYYVTLDMAKELCMIQNNPKGREARQYFIKCEKEYWKLIKYQARQAELRATKEWQNARIEGKRTRRQETDAIKEFAAYCTAHGSSNGDRYYGNITEMINCILFGINPKKGVKHLRDKLDTRQLLQLEIAEDVVSCLLREEMAKETEYHEIYRLTRHRIDSLAVVIHPVAFLAAPVPKQLGLWN